MKKEYQGAISAQPAEADMEAINRLAKRPLTAEEVYTFALRLCDNEVDRDFECFSEAALHTLGELFVGKSGIFDHQWSAEGQMGRIYRTEVCFEPEGVSESGERRCYLKGYAYMLRSEKNKDLIEEIEGGIKKEVSVGCAVSRRVCSICGCEDGSCGHEKGQRYGGKLCFYRLEEPTDAYEWSFVAVPAQRRAGVMKGGATLKELAERNGAVLEEWTQLQRQAELGRRYLNGLRREVKRLAMLSDDKLDGAVMEGITEKLDEAELLALKGGYEAQAGRRFPLVSQLGGAGHRETERDETVFLV